MPKTQISTAAFADTKPHYYILDGLRGVSVNSPLPFLRYWFFLPEAVWLHLPYSGPYGDICAGFSLTGTEFTAGFLRLLFSFSAGILLFRIFKPTKIKGVFWICSLSIIVLLAVPRIGRYEHLWMNGIYDTLCCVLV